MRPSRRMPPSTTSLQQTPHSPRPSRTSNAHSPRWWPPHLRHRERGLQHREHQPSLPPASLPRRRPRPHVMHNNHRFYTVTTEIQCVYRVSKILHGYMIFALILPRLHRLASILSSQSIIDYVHCICHVQLKVLNNIHKMSIPRHHCMYTLDESACFTVHGMSQFINYLQDESIFQKSWCIICSTSMVGMCVLDLINYSGHSFAHKSSITTKYYIVLIDMQHGLSRDSRLAFEIPRL